MNNYLIWIGSNFIEIRQLLNLTQEDLAKRMGVSRPTIVKIEQDPSRLTKTIAFAFFVAISYELKKRLRSTKEINPSAFNSFDSLDKFIKTISKSSLLPLGTIVTTATLGLGGILPGIGAAIASAAGIKWGLKNSKISSNNNQKQKNEWDEEKSKKVLEEIQKKLLDDQNKLLTYLHLDALDISQFVEKINDHESVNNESK